MSFSALIILLMSSCGSFAYSVLRRFLPEEKVESIKGLALTADGKGAVFDVAAEDLDLFLKGTFHSLPLDIEIMWSW